MITWLHISDLHFRPKTITEARWVLNPLLDDIREHIERGVKPDFIAVTGDIAFGGKLDEYELARDFFGKLLDITGLERGRLFLVPGNHDVDRDRVTFVVETTARAILDRDSANKVLAGPEDRKTMFSLFDGYHRFLEGCLPELGCFDPDHYFYVHSLPLAGWNIAILGLNSAWVCTHDEEKPLLGELQTRAALDRSKDADLRIALLHHPFGCFREFDNQSKDMLTDGCHFILHGHLHETEAAQLSTPDGAATILAGGASYDKRERPNKYNLVQLDLSTGKGVIYFRRYADARRGFWASDTLIYKNAPSGEYPFTIDLDR